MREAGKIWMNGRLVPFKEARVHVLTHALHYSTAVFEGIRCYRTPGGPAIFRLDDHVERLYASARLYSMRMRFARKRVRDGIIATVRASGLAECYIRPLAYYGYGEMGVTPRNRVDVAIACWEWDDGGRRAGRHAGARCKVSSWAKIDSRFQPMRAKAASNYANVMLARMEALENGYDEAIMLNASGSVAEGGTANIFAVRGGAVVTPPASAGGLAGITRDSVIRIAGADGVPVSEADLVREDLYSADEVFMTGTAAEVRAVTRIDGVPVGTGRTGPVTRSLQDAFYGAARGADGRFSSWLTPV